MDENTIYKTINTEQLNIMEPDGTLKLCLFNSRSIPPLIMDGEDIKPGHRQGDGSSGIIFFNSEGDECGGMSFTSHKTEDGGYRSSLSITFDQYKNDQIVQMFTNEVNKKRSYGFRLFDRPDAHLRETIADMLKFDAMTGEDEKSAFMADMAKKHSVRMLAGKAEDGSVGIMINDKSGKPRLRIVVGPDDNPVIEFLDSDGSVTKRIPE